MFQRLLQVFEVSLQTCGGDAATRKAPRLLHCMEVLVKEQPSGVRNGSCCLDVCMQLCRQETFMATGVAMLALPVCHIGTTEVPAS